MIIVVPVDDDDHNKSPDKESQHVVGAEVAFKDFFHDDLGLVSVAKLGIYKL